MFVRNGCSHHFINIFGVAKVACRESFMENIAPTKIESVLLYQEYENIDPQKILQHLNGSLESTDLNFEIVQAGAQGEFILMMCGDLHVLVSQTPNPLDMEGFNQTLASPYTQMTLKNADEIVYRHRSHVFITVGNGVPMPDNSELQELIQKVEHQQSPGQFELKLTICKLMTSFFARNQLPTAVHWLQSNILLPSENFLLLASDPFPIPLFVHPGLFSSRNTISGVPVLGLRTFGASHLIGYEITFIEAPVPLRWLYERACNFVSIARDRGSLIPHGESFGVDNDEVIRVRHRPASDDRPAGEIELTLELSSEFELDDNKLPVSQPVHAESEAEIALDQNDPIDRAILERLKQAGQNMREVLEEKTPVLQEADQQSSFGQRGSKLFH